MKTHIINTVWGDEYLKVFLEYSLPLQLTPGNLGALKGTGKYRIFTTNRDREIIQNSSIFPRFSSLIEVEFIPIEISSSQHKIHKMNLCHSLAIQHAGLEQAAMIFLCADSILSKDSFQTILEFASNGKRAVLVGSPRLLKEQYCPLYDAISPLKEGLEPRALARIAMKSFHPFSESFVWGRDQIYHAPSHIYWKIDHANLLVRGFHLHPLFVWPENHGVIPNISIDYDYLTYACPSMDRWKIIEDSDEMAVFEISPKSLAQTIKFMKRSYLSLALWAEENTKPIHNFFAQKKYLIHSDDPLPSWEEIFKKSDKVIERIINRSRLLVAMARIQKLALRARNKALRICRSSIKSLRSFIFSNPL